MYRNTINSKMIFMQIAFLSIFKKKLFHLRLINMFAFNFNADSLLFGTITFKKLI